MVSWCQKVAIQFFFNSLRIIFKGDSSGTPKVELGEESLGKQFPLLSAFHLPYLSRLYHRVIPEPR